MRIDSRCIRFAAVFSLNAFCLTMTSGAFGQTPAAQAVPAAQSNPAAPPPPPPLPPRSQDYPDPRGFNIGVYYWAPLPGSKVDVKGGEKAGLFEDVLNIGKPKQGYLASMAYPISRTGDLRLELFQTRGSGSQILPQDSAPFGLQYAKGDLLSTGFKLRGGKIFIDDLFWPHKYPVAKFRLKSQLGLMFLQAKGLFDAPLRITSSSLATFATNGTRQTFLPVLGMSAEYAIAKHALFRAGGSGFALPGKSYYYDGDASFSVRRNHLEVVVGYKLIGFRNTPKSDNYLQGLVSGGYGGLRWHF